MSIALKKYISFNVDFGAGHHDRNIDLSDVEITEAMVSRLFDSAKEKAIEHLLKVRPELAPLPVPIAAEVTA